METSWVLLVVVKKAVDQPLNQALDQALNPQQATLDQAISVFVMLERQPQAICVPPMVPWHAYLATQATRYQEASDSVCKKNTMRVSLGGRRHQPASRLRQP